MTVPQFAFPQLRTRWFGRPETSVRPPQAQHVAPQPTRPRRIVLYSHDTQGMGHMRRNLIIAKALLKITPRPNILMIGGAREMGRLVFPDGIDCLTLPALGKRSDGQYQPRSLSVSLDRLVGLRAQTIGSAIEAFDPDVLIVDKVPLGAFQELEPSLQWLRSRGTAHCVLGLREILDDPQTARREWQQAGSDAAIRAYYDAIWVYGDRAVYDPVREYGFAHDVAAKISYTGYIDRSVDTHDYEGETTRLLDQMRIDPRCRVVLGCVGGGQDGSALAETFARTSFPDDMIGVLVTGPFMSLQARQRLQQIAASNPRLHMLTFVEETAPLLRRADAVIAMGGYNTVCEVLAFEKHALIVPRVKPRREQLIRAERLRDLGLIDMLHPHDLTPDALSCWLAQVPHTPPRIRDRIDLGCLTHLPTLLDRLWNPATSPEERYATA